MVGKAISHYQIIEKIGEGGMGVGYKARDNHLDRFVAIKILLQKRSLIPNASADSCRKPKPRRR